MDIYTTEASALSGFGPALDTIANLLNIPQESNEVIKEIQVRIALFFRTIKSDVKLVIETDYVDKVYRDSYYQYYSSKQLEYNRNCVRISLFK